MLINMALTFRAVSLSLRTLTWCLPLGLDTALTSFPTPYSSPARTLGVRGGEGAEEGPTSMPRRPSAHRLAAVRGVRRARWVAGGGAGRQTRRGTAGNVVRGRTGRPPIAPHRKRRTAEQNRAQGTAATSA